MFMQQTAGPAIIPPLDDAQPEPGMPGHAESRMAPAVAAAAMTETGPTRQKRGRPRTRSLNARQVTLVQNPALAAEAALVAETDAVISNLQRQGVLKPPAADLAGGGPGHRTKNCRPVQINLSETMFRQLKMIAATQSISIKDQIIAALVQQGYKG